MTLGPHDLIYDPITHRPTLAFIKEQARDHVAYGWSARPGSWDHNMVLTDDDTIEYLKEYRRVSEATK